MFRHIQPLNFLFVLQIYQPRKVKYFNKLKLQKQIQSTTDPSTALGLGTISSIKTTVVDQQGQVNYNHQLLLNMNGSQSGEDIPPKGVLALCFSLLNQKYS